MFNLTNMAKKLIIAVVVIYFAMTFGAFLFFFGDADGFIRFALGLFLGSLASCIRVVSMDNSVRKTVESGKDGALAFLLRYFLTVAIVAVAVIFDIFNMWATIAGVLSLQVAAYAVPLISKED